MKDKTKRALISSQSVCEDQLAKILQKWHDFMAFEKRMSDHTLYNYVLDVEDFARFMFDYKGQSLSLALLIDLHLHDFRAFMAYRVRKGVSPRSNRRAMSALKNLFGFLEKTEGFVSEGLHALASPKLEKSLPKPIAKNRMDEMLDLSTLYKGREKWVQLRDEALMILLYGCGLRISEALNLNMSDLNPTELRITGKRNKQRVAPVLPVVYDKIQAYLNARPGSPNPDSPVFIGVRGDRLLSRTFQKNMEKIRIALGLPETATPHALRHSFASHLLGNGADLRSLQELMGHDSLASTQVYTKLEDAALFDTYLKAHPLSGK